MSKEKGNYVKDSPRFADSDNMAQLVVQRAKNLLIIISANMVQVVVLRVMTWCSFLLS